MNALIGGRCQQLKDICRPFFMKVSELGYPFLGRGGKVLLAGGKLGF